MSPITFHNFLLLVKAIYMLSLMYFWKPEYFTDDTTINNINFKNNIGEKSAMQNNHVISRILPTAFISLTLRFRCVNINYLYPTDLLKVEANSSYSRNSYFSIWNAPSIQDIHTGVADNIQDYVFFWRWSPGRILMVCCNVLGANTQDKTQIMTQDKTQIMTHEHLNLYWSGSLYWTKSPLSVLAIEALTCR